MKNSWVKNDMKKIRNCKDFFCEIRTECKDCLKKVKNNGGINFYLRALVAQILWLTLIYNVGILLIPAKDYLLSNSILLFVAINTILIRTVAGNKISGIIDSYASGNFFYRFDINLLNKSIAFLIFLASFFIFMNNVNLSNLKLYERRK